MHRFAALTFLAVVVSILWGPACRAQAPDSLALDLESTIDRALDVSPEVGASREAEEFARARLQLARASRYLTEFTVTTAHAPVPGLTNPNGVPTDRLFLDPEVRNDFDKLRIFNQLEAEVIQPLFTWGGISSSIKAARYGTHVEEAAVEKMAHEVALRTGELYYNLLLARELSRIVDETGSIVEQAKSEIRRMIDEGNPDVDDADLYQVLITEQEYNRRVVEVEERLHTAESALRRQLFIPDETPIALADRLLEPLAFTRDSLSTYFATALDLRPEMRQAREGLAARTALVDVARSDYFPKLFAGANYNIRGAAGRYRQDGPFHGDPFRGNSIEAGFGLRQKLNFAQTKAKVSQAKAELNEVDFQLQAARQLILFEVEGAYRDFLIAESALEAQNEALRLSREWLQLESINFDLDLGDTENLVKAVRANLELQAQAQQAVHKYNVAVLRLYNATGSLTRLAGSGTLVDN